MRRPTYVGPGTFAAWIRRNGERLFISTITIAEIEAGIPDARAGNPSPYAA